MSKKFTKLSGLTVNLMILTILLGIVIPTHASAATLTVPTEYETIQEAIDAAVSGDTVYVKAGTYYEQLTIRIPLVLQGEDKSTTIIDGSGSGNVILLYDVDNAIISDITVRNGNSGIYLPYSSYNTIRNVIVCNNAVHGIDVGDRGSPQNILENVEVYSNQNGICAYAGSNYLTILDSNCHNNEVGILVGWSSYLTVENTVSYSNTIGIGIDWDSYSTITNCKLYDNTEGITIWGGTQGNNVNENQIYENEIGIKILDYSSHNNNIFFHNDLKNEKNVVNEGNWVSIWDNGYPDGGNFYSDYTGNDQFSGPDQNVAGSDGIGDSAYYIINNNVDNYPLMEPWHSDFPLNDNPIADEGTDGNNIPEFPSIALPVAAFLGLVAVFGRRKEV